MILSVDLDDDMWELFKDDGSVERAAKEALSQIDWPQTISASHRAYRRGGGAVSGRCLALWCVKLAGIEPQVCHCLSARDQRPEAEMVNKFAASFQALREALTTGEPFIRVYDEPRMASEALREFEQVHDGHETSVRLIGEDIVTTCLVCGDDFREQYS